jgi:ribosomal protein S18 acetylase RimI-like enzyme
VSLESPRAAGAVHVVPLGPAQAHWWVEGGPAEADPAGMTAHIRDFLAAETGSTLFAAIDGDRAIARLQTLPVGSCGLGIYAVGFRDDLAPAAMAAACDALLDTVAAVAAEAPGVRYIETDVPGQAPGHAAWRAALCRHGIVEVAASHTYARAIGAPAAPDAAGLAFRPVGALSEALVEAVYQASYAGTADESHRLSPEPFSVRLRRLKELPLLAPDHTGWLVAFDGETPLGLVFASVECAPYGSPERGWILEIGVTPEARGRGLGRTLLAQGLSVLAGRGVRQALARIDDMNAPSLRLFAVAGFARQADPCWVHRRVW